MAPSLSGLVASEDGLVEQPALALLQELGWECVNLYHDQPGPQNAYGRTSLKEPHLPARLRAALKKLNPGKPPEALKLAEEELTRDRTALQPIAANREVLRLLREGVRVEVKNDQGKFEDVLIRVIDWKEPANNDFLVANQVWIKGVLHKRRPDTIGYVNGLPLLFIECKNTHKSLKSAHNVNLAKYKAYVPELFHHNALIILTNGIDSRVGSLTSPYGYFQEC